MASGAATARKLKPVDPPSSGEESAPTAKLPELNLAPTLEQQAYAIRRAIAVLEEEYPRRIERGEATQAARDAHLLWLLSAQASLESAAAGVDIREIGIKPR